MASAHGVCSTKGNNLLVIEAHSVEDLSQMVLSLGGIWESSIRRDVVFETIDSACSPWDGGSARLLNSDDTS